jgi:hypothetical protein
MVDKSGIRQEKPRETLVEDFDGSFEIGAL